MSEQQSRPQYGEKDEKQEKQHEKEEKSWEEKWQRDPLGAAVWAIILIWAGVVLLVSNLGLLPQFEFFDAWAVFFIGAGILLLLEAAFRFAVPAYRQPLMGNLILASVFLAIGLGGLVSWAILWAVALIAIGSFILLRGLFLRRE